MELELVQRFQSRMKSVVMASITTQSMQGGRAAKSLVKSIRVEQTRPVAVLSPLLPHHRRLHRPVLIVTTASKHDLSHGLTAILVVPREICVRIDAAESIMTLQRT